MVVLSFILFHVVKLKVRGLCLGYFKASFHSETGDLLQVI